MEAAVTGMTALLPEENCFLDITIEKKLLLWSFFLHV